MRQFDIAVIIGRFQPFHSGHKFLIDEALVLAERVVVLVGSANASISVKNPFTFKERETMILETYMAEMPRNPSTVEINHSSISRLSIKPLKDFTYNNERWVQEVQSIVDDEADGTTRQIVLIGHSKDESSFYLKMFPQWAFREMPHKNTLNASDMRNTIFNGMSYEYLRSVVPSPVMSFLHRFEMQERLMALKEEFNFIKKYKASWAGSPYEPVFVTADAVVIQQGHILLVKRGAMPGKGLWALPGGFINPGEKLKEGAIRELREETRLKVPVPVLKGSIVANKVFDEPDRSSRGRTFTQAFLFHLTNIDQGLPKVKGSDDAAEAMWVPLSQLKGEDFFEDHFHIIQDMVGML